MTIEEAKDQVARNHYYSSWDLLCRNGNHSGTPDEWIDEVCQLLIKEMDDKTLETQVANTSIDLLNSELESLRKRCEDLDAANQQLNLKVREDAVRFAMYMSGKSTIGDQGYFIRSFDGGYFKTWKIDN